MSKTCLKIGNKIVLFYGCNKKKFGGINMKKKILKFAVPIMLVALATTSYAVRKNDLLPQSHTYTIDNKISGIENSIDLLQVRSFEELEGVSNLFYYDGESNIIFGMNSEFDKIGAFDDDKNQDLTKYCRTLYGDVYTTDIDKLNPVGVKLDGTPLKSLDTEFGAAYSPDGKFIDFIEEDNSYIYDVENKNLVKYEDHDLVGNWTENSKLIIKYGNVQEDEMTERKFLLFNKNGDIVRSVALDGQVDWVNISSHFYSETGSEVYFTGRVREGNDLMNGVYKLNTYSGNIEKVFSFIYSRVEQIKNPGTDLKEHPGKYIDVYKQSHVYDYQLLDNGDIIFDAMIDNTTGLYLYNSTSNSYSLLLEYNGALTFKVAPDQKKIVYTVNEVINHSESKSNIYVANIDDDTFKDITFVKKNSHGYSFKWSNDSKKLVFFEPNNSKITLVKFK